LDISIQSAITVVEVGSAISVIGVSLRSFACSYSTIREGAKVMQRTILLVRHGETEWNRARRYQGWSDSALTERGIAQAEAIGRALKSLPEAATAPLVASPIGRARRTAEIIHSHLGSTAPVQFDDRLREISLGSWEGLDRAELSTLAPGLFDDEDYYEWYFRTANGETYEGFSARIADWLGSAGEEPMIVVTHGIVTRVLRGLYAGLSRSAALRLPVPQDRIYRLADGLIDELSIDCE
jgi:broad specificity phosphatase PhoE